MTAGGSPRGPYPSPAQCVPVCGLALQLLADLRDWTRTHDWAARTPMEAMALSAAVISPWRGADELRWCLRLCVWWYALDDFTERDGLVDGEFDDMLLRCGAIVRTGAPDTRHPLLAGLSEIQNGLSQGPLYPALAGMWTERFDRAVAAIRSDWYAVREESADAGAVPSVEQYLARAESVSVWPTHLPRWLCAHDPAPLRHLDSLVPALDHCTVAIRLANDLSTEGRLEHRPGENNVLRYGVTPRWAREQRDVHVEAVRSGLAPLLADGCPPAVEVLRLAEWAVGYYDHADFRDHRGRGGHSA